MSAGLRRLQDNVDRLKQCCRDKRKFEELKRLVESGVDIYSYDACGMNALLYAALGLDGKPNVEAFNYLFKIAEQNITTEEKLNALELLGSSHILIRDYGKGLDCWKRAAKLRSIARNCIPENMLPVATRQYVRAEWSDLNDVIQMEKEINTPAGELNIFYQAMLTRLQLHKSSCSDDLNQLFAAIVGNFLKLGDGWVNREVEDMHPAKWIVFLFEWDEMYASHSLIDSLYELIDMFVFLFAVEFKHHQNFQHLACFENCMVLLQWMTTNVERASESAAESKTRARFSEPTRLTDSRLTTILDIISLICRAPLDEQQTLRFEACLERLAALDLHDARGRNLFLLACAYLSGNNDEGQDCPQVPVTAETVRLLVEAGANLDSADKHGETCLHLLIKPNGCFVDEALVHFLEERGALLGVFNLYRETPKDKMNRLSIETREREDIIAESVTYVKEEEDEEKAC